MRGEDTCTICCEELSAAPAHELRCGHAFHTTCVIDWFRMGGCTCPLCRSADFQAHTVPMSAPERVRRLRRAAARADAPEALKALVNRIKRRRAKQRLLRLALRSFRAANERTISAERELVHRLERSSTRMEDLRDELLAFSHPQVSVPLLEHSDSDESDAAADRTAAGRRGRRFA